MHSYTRTYTYTHENMHTYSQSHIHTYARNNLNKNREVVSESEQKLQENWISDFTSR